MVHSSPSKHLRCARFRCKLTARHLEHKSLRPPQFLLCSDLHTCVCRPRVRGKRTRFLAHTSSSLTPKPGLEAIDPLPQDVPDPELLLLPVLEFGETKHTRAPGNRRGGSSDRPHEARAGPGWVHGGDLWWPCADNG